MNRIGQKNRLSGSAGRLGKVEALGNPAGDLAFGNQHDVAVGVGEVRPLAVPNDLYLH